MVRIRQGVLPPEFAIVITVLVSVSYGSFCTDDEKDDSTYEGKTHHDGEAEDGDTLGVESKQAERPAMSEVLGEAEPVKQPSARERRMAALAAAERRAGKK